MHTQIVTCDLYLTTQQKYQRKPVTFLHCHQFSISSIEVVAPSTNCLLKWQLILLQKQLATNLARFQ